jgi:hypothetical protein
MKYQHATIVLTNAVAVNLRKLSQMLERSETDGMFTTPLSATGALPVTHWISSGMVPKAYVTVLNNPTQLKQAADAAYAAESLVQPFSLAQITNALSQCTISDGTTTVDVDGIPTVVLEDPHALLVRLGLKLI